MRIFLILNRFQTGNGISVEQVGFLKSDGRSAEPIQVIQGRDSYTAPNGEVVSTAYLSDENGFQVQGSHLPKSPPIPEAIAKALAYLATLPSTPDPYPQ